MADELIKKINIQNTEYSIAAEFDDSGNDINATYMTKDDPTGAGFFSMNRGAGERGEYSSTLGFDCVAAGDYSHAEGYITNAMNETSHAEGSNTTASGVSSHAEGQQTTAGGNNSHAEGYETIASGDTSHAEGVSVNAEGNFSHAEGVSTSAKGPGAHAEGGNIADSGAELDNYSAFDSNGNPLLTIVGPVAYGVCSHAEGVQTFAAEWGGHAEGVQTIALGHVSHAEGRQTSAEGDYSHTEGGSTVARGTFSHAEGYNTKANGKAQHVQGRFNIEDSVGSDGVYAHIIGNGTADDARSNAHTVDWDGNAWYAGDLQLGGNILQIGGATLTYDSATNVLRLSF